MINRREFIKNIILGTTGIGIVKGDEMADMLPEKKLKIREYRKLGNTDFKVSDISIGGFFHEGVLRAALKAGINYIDTSELYSSFNHEKMIGSVIEDFKRKDLFITGKVFRKPFKSKEDILQRVDNSLKKLNTSYLDCLMIHQVEDTAIVKDEFFHQAAAELMEKGKVLHLGIACHGSSFVNPTKDSMEDIFMTAIDDGRFDMLFMAYNFLERDGAEKILKLCSQKKIGTCIMKANPVFSYNQSKQLLMEMEEKGEKISDFHNRALELTREKTMRAREFFENNKIMDEKNLQAVGTKFVLSNPFVNTVVNSVMSFSALNDILEVSGQKLKTKEIGMVHEYKEILGFLNCRIGCSQCEPTCPHHVPVNDIMRYNYYFQVKKQEKMAMEAYASLEGCNANICSDCPGHCMAACPHQVVIQPLLQMAHRNLEVIPGLAV